MQLGRTSPARAVQGADRGDPLDQWDEGLAVVEIRPRDPDGYRQTRSFGDQVDLRAVLAPIDRIRTCQVPLFRARMFTESIAQRLQSSSPRAPSSSRTKRWSLAQPRARL